MDTNLDVISATERLRDLCVVTHVSRLTWLERIVGVPVFAKLEFQQHTGSFKFRGATNAVLTTCKHTVVTASAGNHGLAVAVAAREHGVTAKICLPTNASRLKRDKLVAIGAEIVEQGDDLRAAAEHAKQLARRFDWDYISPFADQRVISANTTLFIEALKQSGDVSHLIVPTGGGGLLAGACLARRIDSRRFDILAAEAGANPSFRHSNRDWNPHAPITFPSLADGLAVTPTNDEHNGTYLKDEQFEIGAYSEEELAAGTLALLTHESWLVEPSGAIGIAATLRAYHAHQLTGPVLLVLTGGNVSRGNLARVLSFNYSNPALEPILMLRGEKISEALPAKNITVPARQTTNDTPSSTDSSLIGGGGRLALSIAIRSFDNAADLIDGYLNSYEAYCDHHSIVYTNDIVVWCKRIVEEARVLADGHRGGETTSHRLNVSLNTFRALNIALNDLRRQLDWQSPAYEQAIASQFFRVSSQDNPNVNYSRYWNPDIGRVESQLREVLGIAPYLDASCTVTSSGMAAYTLVEAYLLRSGSTKSNSIMLAPYIYFEAAEQLESLSCYSVTRFSSFDADCIVDEVIKNRPAVIFVDPIANNATLRVCDISRVVERLRYELQHPVVLIVDGTMASAELPRFLFAPHPHTALLDIIYYESASKYLQYGFELSLAGVVAHAAKLKPTFERLRRNSGAILGVDAAQSFPTYSLAEYNHRKDAIGRAAAYVATSIASDSRCKQLIDVYYPTLSSHPDYKVAPDVRFKGGCISFVFCKSGFNTNDNLNAFITYFLSEAKKRSCAVVKGVSFGFSVSRISAASSMAETEPPFLRLYVAPMDSFECDVLAKAFTHSMLVFTQGS